MLATLTTACSRTSVKDADVVMSNVSAATVVSEGVAHPAREGERLRRGDLVRTDKGGAVTLTVRARRVLLRGETEVIVPDGANVELVAGAILVDRRRGPAVNVRAGEARIDRVRPGAVRVDRSFSVQVAVYSGGVRVATSSGRQLGVPALHQTVVPGRALPAVPDPLVLTDGDAWERQVIPTVVATDVKLTQLARGIDAGWTGSQATVVPAVFREVTAAAGTPPSETVLPRAIGEAAARHGASGDPFGQAARLRGAGGSWGVVAALLDTGLADVSAALADLLRGVEPTPVPSVPGSGSGGTPSPGPSGSGTGSSGSPSPRPTGSGPGPTGSPSPSQSPRELIDDVLDNLPTPLPTPTLPGIDLQLLGVVRVTVA